MSTATTTIGQTQAPAAKPSAKVARPPWLKLLPEDGFLTVALLMAVVYTTVASIQAVNPPWALGLHILTATTWAGFLLGYLVVQQGRIPGVIAHSVAVLLGVALALYEAAGYSADGNMWALLRRTRTWFDRALLSGQSSDDNGVFLLFLASLTFLLAYISFWLVLNSRRPWLAVLANGSVLLINLSWTEDNMILFFVLFLLSALLLLVRFTLAENMRVWRRRGLRFSPDLSWDFMQTGTIFAVVIVLAAYLLPAGASSAQIQAYLNNPKGPWQQIQARFGQAFNGLSGTKGLGNGEGIFSNNVHLVGSVDLPDTEVLHYTPGSEGDATQYLLTDTFDHYDGTSIWSATPGKVINYAPNQIQPPSGSGVKTVTYSVTYDAMGGGGQTNLFVPGAEAASFNLPASTIVGDESQTPMSWTSQKPVQDGDSYNAQSYISTATEQQLRAVPYPADATKGDTQNQYPDAILKQYVQPNSPYISAEVRQAALQYTQGDTSMYVAAQHLEDYLRTFTYATHNPNPPENQDATAWFLKQKRGYCTFFASAMALMGRALGMPTRVATGFIAGNYDTKTNTYVVKGTAAHAWTQIYFAKYGWVNFEPTTTFKAFDRGFVAPVVSPTTGSSIANAGGPTATPRDKLDPTLDPNTTGTTSGSGALSAALIVSGLLLLLLAAAAVAMLWWRLLFRGLAPGAAIFGRLTRLGTWAGVAPQPAQTPTEYTSRLGDLIPGHTTTFQQLGDAYTRERWGGGVSPEVANKLPSMYDRVRASLTKAITRRIQQAPLDVVRGVRRKNRPEAPDLE